LPYHPNFLLWVCPRAARTNSSYSDETRRFIVAKETEDALVINAALRSVMAVSFSG
jgi:hypothetical protein